MSTISNPFTLDTVRLPVDRIVDRARQVEFLNEHVIVKRENVLVVGAFGIGKTCILRKFRDALPQERGSRILIVEMEMRRVSEDASQFLSDVLIKLLGVFWSEVLRRDFSELIQAVTNPSEFREKLVPQVSRVLDLYRVTRPKKIVSNFEDQSVFGVDKIVKATGQRRVGRTIERGELTPSEFVLLAGEMLGALNNEGVTRTLIFGDEANHIDPDVEVDLIRRNFEVFADRNVQFILTAKPEVISRVPRLRDAFPACLDVEPFDNRLVLDELLEVYTGNAHTPIFPESARNMIWRISKGNPREIQILCRECADIAISRTADGTIPEVDLETLIEAISLNYELRPR